MQYEQESPSVRRPLPRPSIDTGMGLERIAAVLQGVHDNYDTDLFRALIAAAEDAIGTRAEGSARPSFKVIADHLRATCFLMADGVMPSNEGRGYVLRRIMRRASVVSITMPSARTSSGYACPIWRVSSGTRRCSTGRVAPRRLAWRIARRMIRRRT